MCLAVGLLSQACRAGAVGRHVRVDNPTGYQMDWNEIEIFSGGKNIVLHHPEMFTGTIWPDHDMKTRDGKTMTDGDTNVTHRGASFIAGKDVYNEPHKMAPWFEVDLGESVEIEKIVLSGSNWPQRFYLDKGDRAVSVLDEKRKVVWAGKFNYYRSGSKTGIFSLEPAAGEKNPTVGMTVADPKENWVPMAWLLGADEVPPLPDAARRMKHFEARNSPAEIEKLARKLFPLLDDKTPGLEKAFEHYTAGKYEDALNAWKKYWFAKMQKANLHWGFMGDYWTYPTNGDDLVNGIAVTISAESAGAIRFIPGQIHWIDLPKADDPNFRNALIDAQQKAEVNKVSRPLIDAYLRKPDAKYMQRWSEMMDDWSLNFFEDAVKVPYEVENLFTFSPGLGWQRMLEDLSDLAKARPDVIDVIPASTLARRSSFASRSTLRRGSDRHGRLCSIT